MKVFTMRLCVWFLCFGSSVMVDSAVLSETQLHETLFHGYKTDVRPRINISEPLDIKLDMYVMSIESIDEKRQTFTLRAFLEITWRDDFLSWEPDKYGGVKSINVPNEKIWMPDLALLDVYDTLTDLGQAGGRTVIDHEGSVLIWPFKMYTVGCKMKIRRFPFDIQTCSLDFTSWTNPVSVLDLKTSDTPNLGRYSENAEWELERFEHEHYLQPYGADAWGHIKFTFILKRKWLFQVINIITPIVIISLLNLTCFVLPVQCGEKMGLSITIFLTLAVFMTIIISSMPESSDEFSVLGVYVGLQLLGSAMTIFATVCSICLYHRNKSAHVPRVFCLLGKMCCQSEPPKSTERNDDSGRLMPTVAKLIENDVMVSDDRCKSSVDCSKALADRSKSLAVPCESQVTWEIASRAFDRLCLWTAICWHTSLMIGFIVGTIA